VVAGKKKYRKGGIEQVAGRLKQSHKKVRLLTALALSVALAVPGLTSSSAAPSRSELERAKQRLMELERDFEIVVERYNRVNERLTEIQATIGRTQLEADRLSNRIESKEASAVAIAVTLYKQGSAGALDAVLSSESLAEMETRLNYLNSSQEAQATVFEELTADRTELDGVIADLEEARAQALATKAELADLRDEIDAKVEDQRGEIEELQRAIARAERRREAREAARAAAAAAAAAASQQQATTPPPSGPIPSVKASSPNAQAAVDAALAQVGDPYQWGGAGPDSFDCSGLTMYAWAQAGVGLPHNSAMQYSSTARVAQADLEPGDLLFFGSPIHHVGMYIGSGQMVEAPYTGAFVRVTSAFRSDYVGAGRPGV
jgi:cell wall-associated NlpC family hydrolase